MLPLNGGGSRGHLPASRMRLFSRITLFDAAWVALSPVLAFLIRDGAINRVDDVAIYSSVAFIISIIVFQWFRISSPLPHFFSSHDAFTIAKASVTAVALTAVLLFTVTRLNQAPRSIPIIHVLLLTAGLVGVRAWNRWARTRATSANYHQASDKLEAVIVVGATRLAWFYSMMVDELSSEQRRIVGVVDERSQLLHRTLNGYAIIGLPAELPKIIDEYATHGVEINKVVVAEHPRDLAEKTRNDIQAVCEAKSIQIEWLHQTFSVSHAKSVESSESCVEESDFAAIVMARPYWKIKRLIDILVALAMIITLAPLTVLVAVLVLIDVGVPIVFWQQRVGHRGRPFRVYKFRTMRSLFDRGGRPTPEAERLSLLGRLLRHNHLDEVPQLFNVLSGSMSLIGPRPLLPVDQPKDIRLRHLVRPGLTGLAQVSGGTSLSADEKSVLDEWYINHASLLLDIQIIVRTIWVLIRGNPRDHAQISAALAEKQVDANGVFEPGLSRGRADVASAAGARVER